jgi:hypothetical protein
VLSSIDASTLSREDGMKRRHGSAAVGNSVIFAATFVIVLGALVFYSVALSGTGGPTTSTAESTAQGIIAGFVTVGPSQPVCVQGQTCTVDIAGYSLVFISQCGASSSTSCQGQDFTAQIGPNGHYSIMLAPGNYVMTGLAPSCNWLGCSLSFPKAVAVEGGQQIIVNVEIDTGIR